MPLFSVLGWEETPQQGACQNILIHLGRRNTGVANRVPSSSSSLLVLSSRCSSTGGRRTRHYLCRGQHRERSRNSQHNRRKRTHGQGTVWSGQRTAPVQNDVSFGLLMKATICSPQEGCMKPGDRLLAVNGESVLGCTVEKVERRETSCTWMDFLLSIISI